MDVSYNNIIIMFSDSNGSGQSALITQYIVDRDVIGPTTDAR